MTRDGGGTGGPYQAETNQNTSLDWLNDMTPVQAKLDDMSDYGKALMTISNNLQSHRMRITGQLGAMIKDGAFQGGVPEVNYAAQLHAQNMSEFSAYLQNLFDGLQRTANAAQAIADSYGGNDVFSAISLNAVQFAFGDPDATRPAGLPQGVGETFWDKQAKATMQTQGQGSAHPDAVWTQTGTTTDAYGNVTSTYTDQYGETRTVAVSYDPNGHKITKMSGPEGTTTSVEATYTYPYGSVTTTTTTDAKGKVTTSESNMYTTGDTTTTEVSRGGKVSSVTTVTYRDDGSQTSTTYAVDGKGHRTATQQISVGHDDPVDLGEPDSPGADAISDARASMPKDHTKILAPGPALNGKQPSPGGGSPTTVA